MYIPRQLTLGLIYSTASLLLVGCTPTTMLNQPATTSPTAAPSESPILEPSVKPELSLEAARTIAEKSECAKAGQISQSGTYNPYSKTWWFDLAAEKPGCKPACVVSETAKTASINWRCTGALPPSQDPVIEEQ